MSHTNPIPHNNPRPTPTELAVAQLYQEESLTKPAAAPRIPQYAADEVHYIHLSPNLPRHTLVQFSDGHIACSCGRTDFS